MAVPHSNTVAQGRRAFEEALVYGALSAVLAAADMREHLGRGLYRGDEAAELRAKLRLEKVRPWVRAIDAERERLNSGF
jgi:hypothetical protein